MGLPNEVNSALIGAAAAGGYQINQSLRFNSADSAYLNRTPGSTSGETQWTCSLWVKFAQSQNTQYLFWAQSGSNYTTCEIGSGQINFTQVNGGSVVSRKVTSQLFRDFSAWYHLVIVWDSANATASERMRLYVNGSRITAFATDSNPPQNHQSSWNQSSYSHTIGRISSSSTYFDGYIAEFNHVSGQALTAASFGETDTITGAWIPKKYSGSYGTNGFYLKFESSGIGTDSSGNGNNWTANNFSTSGTGTDVMSDTPTNNWCTLNPLDKNSNMTLNNGNLDTVGTNGIATATFGLSSGKWYWEATLTDPWYSSAFGLYYFGEHGLSKGGSSGSYDQGAKLYATQYGPAGGTYSNGSRVTAYTTYSTNDVIGFAFDADAMQLDIYRNNTKIGSTLTVPAGNIYPTVYNEGTGGDPGGSTYNFGQRAFAYTPPTGYKALSTGNLSEPTIKKGSSYFNTVLYTGDSNSTQSITGVGFQPDFVWIKNRGTSGTDHLLFDAVRGVTKVLKTVGTGPEETDANAFQSFNSDGFTLGTSTSGNPTKANGSTYAAWCWKEGAFPGLDIVSYNSAVTKPINVSHNLGVKPGFILFFNRITGSSHAIYHQSIGATGAVFINSTGATSTSVDYFNNTEPTSTVFTVYDSTATNNYGTTNAMLAYCFAEVTGFSKFGRYSGNSSTDGVFVYTGFRPAFVMVKNTQGGSWLMHDTARMPYNPASNELLANSSLGEGSSYPLDILSNGFKWRSASGEVNTGTFYVYIAFAERPFKYANAR